MNLGDGRIEGKATNGYLETNDISTLLNVTYGTIYNLINKGKLKAENNGGLYRQRKRVLVEDFKEFLRSNPKYYARVYGEVITKEEPEVEEVKNPINDDISDKVLNDLFAKLESIEKQLDEHKKEIDKLESQKLALEEVIEMF